MKYTLLRQVKHPQKADRLAAGIDFFIPDLWNDEQEYCINPQESVLIPLGIRVEVPAGYGLVFMNKSGISTKMNLAVGACVIDAGYEGEVHAHLYNFSSFKQQIKPGMKIIQGLLLPIFDSELEFVETLENESQRGAGGFGSSGV